MYIINIKYLHKIRSIFYLKMNFAIAVTNKSAKVYKDAPKNKPMKPPTSAYKLSSSYNHNLRIGSSQIRGFENLSFNNLIVILIENIIVQFLMAILIENLIDNTTLETSYLT